MENLIRKHIYHRSEKIMILIFLNYEQKNRSISFSLLLNKTVITYNFYEISCSSKLTLSLLITLLSFLSKVKIMVYFTDDILSFSLCENYLFNKLLKKCINNCFTLNTNKFNNVTFYDYETIREKFLTFS